MPTTPFCPMRLENLSPTVGVRVSRTLTLAECVPSPCAILQTESTTPQSWRSTVLLSRLTVWRAPSPISVVVTVFETTTSPGTRREPRRGRPSGPMCA